MNKIVYQISFDDLLTKRQKLDPVDEAICYSCPFSGSTIRIYAAVVTLEPGKLAGFLREEYGIGGKSIKGGFLDYDGKGIRIRFGRAGQPGCSETALSWPNVAKRIKQLIVGGYFLRVGDERKIDAIRANNGGKLPSPYPGVEYK